MSIRQIEQHDVPTIINLLLCLAEESPVYGQIAQDPDYVSATLSGMIASKSFIGLIDDQGRGCMFGTCAPQWYSPVENAYEQILYVLPDMRGTGLAIRLIRAMEILSKEAGATYLYVGVSTGMQEERTRVLYDRLRYQRHGAGLRKRLN